MTEKQKLGGELLIYQQPDGTWEIRFSPLTPIGAIPIDALCYFIFGRKYAPDELELAKSHAKAYAPYMEVRNRNVRVVSKQPAIAWNAFNALPKEAFRET